MNNIFFSFYTVKYKLIQIRRIKNVKEINRIRQTNAELQVYLRPISYEAHTGYHSDRRYAFSLIHQRIGQTF